MRNRRRRALLQAVLGRALSVPYWLRGADKIVGFPGLLEDIAEWFKWLDFTRWLPWLSSGSNSMEVVGAVALFAVASGLSTLNMWGPRLLLELRNPTEGEKTEFQFIEIRVNECLRHLGYWANRPPELCGFSRVKQLNALLRMFNRVGTSLEQLGVWRPSTEIDDFCEKRWFNYWARIKILSTQRDLKIARKRGPKLADDLPENLRILITDEEENGPIHDN